MCLWANDIVLNNLTMEMHGLCDYILHFPLSDTLIIDTKGLHEFNL